MRGAFLAAMLVGVIDTFGRAYLPQVLKAFLSTTAASTAAPAMASMLIYLLMAALLVWRPTGLFGARN
jgi:branched-chain amino acid transport system permease protein